MRKDTPLPLRALFISGIFVSSPLSDNDDIVCTFKPDVAQLLTAVVVVLSAPDDDVLSISSIQPTIVGAAAAPCSLLFGNIKCTTLLLLLLLLLFFNNPLLPSFFFNVSAKAARANIIPILIPNASLTS